MRGTERLVLAIDQAFVKACGNSESNNGYCDAFLVNGRKLIREALDAQKFEVEFQVDEFQVKMMTHPINLSTFWYLNQKSN